MPHAMFLPTLSGPNVSAPLMLVPVLPDWSPPDYEVYAITARRGEQPAKVRHALGLLAQHFATLGPKPA